ncbi:rhodanese-like domain-containing protein [Pannonibacter carbonis]|uniref:rhodanese-like domain-containing protein n=1 Tax=Pannonibacter carbonis TaxID=2067569 RepID=UPI000D1110A2|nr:rhodanese-like domain-containing protein [Pannonibacter carbonis]
MPQKITTGYQALLDEANARVVAVSPQEAIELLPRDDHIFIDLRDPRELEREGAIPGAFHCPRGMLEFWIDPASPYHKDIFARDATFVFFCAGGWRSALAGVTALDMGLKPVVHLEGGFTAWVKAGGAVDRRA